MNSRQSFCHLIATFLVAVPGFCLASTVQVLESQTFVRGSGAPVPDVVEFTAPITGGGVLTIINGAMDDTLTGERVSSSSITLNDVEVVGPSNFNQNVSSFEVPAQLISGTNRLVTELRSRPGGQISVSIEMGVEALLDIPLTSDPPAFLTGIPADVHFETEIPSDITLDSADVLLFQSDPGHWTRGRIQPFSTILARTGLRST